MMMLPDEVATEFGAIAKFGQTMSFLARAAELQEQAIEQIGQYLPKLASLKTEAVQAADEAQANLLLSMELGLRGIEAELRVCLLLKQEKPEKAWDQLIDAQDCIRGSASVRRQLGIGASGLENLLTKLDVVERWLFPPQMFMSIGGTAKRLECSICRTDYDRCDHIKGRAYMGEICHVIVSEYDLKEVSLVESPANKRCRLTCFSEAGKMRNKMTWRLEGGDSKLADDI